MVDPSAQIQSVWVEMFGQDVEVAPALKSEPTVLLRIGEAIQAYNHQRDVTRRQMEEAFRLLCDLMGCVWWHEDGVERGGGPGATVKETAILIADGIRQGLDAIVVDAWSSLLPLADVDDPNTWRALILINASSVADWILEEKGAKWGVGDRVFYVHTGSGSVSISERNRSQTVHLVVADGPGDRDSRIARVRDSVLG